MPGRVYDLIAVGGGLGGASLARSLAREGARVLVLERELEFRDRVRGEAVLPWGTVESQKLGIYELLASRCGHPVRYWTQYASGERVMVRDFHATTPHGTGCLDFYHPQMQETLLGAAQDEGAEVRRGVVVSHVQPGREPVVRMVANGQSEEIRARLVVGADGRRSGARRWGGFKVNRDPERLQVAGLLLEKMVAPDDSAHTFRFPGTGEGTLLFPLGGGRVRCYFIQRKRDGSPTYSGRKQEAAFVEACKRCGVPADWIDGAHAAGPLATFDGADSWVDHPYQQGVALVGDAAATSDPTWGLGLSLTLRDVRVLADHLRSGDWESGARAYAEEHDRYYSVIHTIENWLTQLIYETGDEADARRARAMPLLAKDPSRIPDAIGIGPDAPCDETARRRLFGEE